MLSIPAHLVDQRRFFRKYQYFTYKVKRCFPWRDFYLRQSVATWREKTQLPMAITLNGNAAKGERILQGQFPVTENRVVEFYQFLGRSKPDENMRAHEVPRKDILYLQGFDWLSDLHELSVKPTPMEENPSLLDSQINLHKCRQFSQNIMLRWAKRHDKFAPVSWHIPTLARRINNWLYYFHHLFGHWPENSELLVLRSITMQLHHLRLCVMEETHGIERIYGLVCWMNASLCLATESEYLEEGKLLLSLELRQQLYDKNSPLLASPSNLENIYCLLQALSQGFLDLKVDIPKEIESAIKRLESLLSHYQIISHRLGLFHSKNGQISQRLKEFPKFRRSKIPPEDALQLPIKRIEHHGFTMMLDTASLQENAPKFMHASALAIELADKQQMIFINATPPMEQQQRTENLAHLPLCHSTVFLEDWDWAESKRGVLHPFYKVRSSVRAYDNQILLEGSHNALALHHRKHGGEIKRKFLFSDDTEHERRIRGVDKVILNEQFKQTAPFKFISQFHLHPSIKAVRNEGGGMILQNQRKNMAWQFSTPEMANARIHLIEIQLQDDGENDSNLLQTLQIVQEVQTPEAGKEYLLFWELLAFDKK